MPSIKAILTVTIMTTVALLNTACTNNPSTNALNSGVILKNMDTTIVPGNNFYNYVDGTWLKDFKIPEDKSRYSTLANLADIDAIRIKNIVKGISNSSFKQGSEKQKVADLYKSLIDVNKRNQIGATPLLEDFKVIDKIKTKAQFADVLAWLVKRGVFGGFAIGVIADSKNPSKHIMGLDQYSSIGLPERDFYLNKDKHFAKIRKEYSAFLVKALKLAKFKNPPQASKKIIALETKIAKIQWNKEDSRNPKKTYNKITTQDIMASMPNFDWQTFLKQLGVSDIKTMVVSQPSYLKDLNAIIGQDYASWKLLFKWMLYKEYSSSLNAQIETAFFNFYGRTLSGTPQQEPLWQRGVNLVNKKLPDTIGKIYVEKYFGKEHKAKVIKIVDNLSQAYKINISRLDWMGANTKKQALKKLKNITVKIGYSNKWQDYSAVEIQADDLYGNTERLAQFAFNDNFADLNKPVDKTKWQIPAQTVNAIYNPQFNAITFPAAILQPPLFNVNVENAVNYGAIGMIIGHEIGHAFDSHGSAYNYEGKLENWWDKKDFKRFKQKSEKLVKQFNKYEVLDGLYVNGRFTLGENMADLGGLTIAIKAYELSLDGKKAPVIDGFSGMQRLFIGSAQAFMSKARDKALRQQIALDPHAPSEFRVNGMVRNVSQFYKAFNVTPEDKLYLAPEDRVKLW